MTKLLSSAALRAAAACIASFLVAAPAALAATLTGSGASLTQQREASGFKGIALSVPAKLEIVQGDREGVSLTADDNLIGEIETVVERDSLHIRWRQRDTNVRKATIRITVNAKAIEAIAIAGSGDVASSSLVAGQLAVRISGSGDVRLAGRAESLAVSISGSGDVDAAKMDTQRASVKIAGSGDAKVWARDSLDVTVAGSGDVRYYGDPKVAKRIAGSGKVRRAGAAPG